MVEHDLAKVGVASSSLVFRSGAGQNTDPLFCCEGDEELATRSPRELPAVPAEGTTKGGRDCPRTRARVSFSALERVRILTRFFVVKETKNSGIGAKNGKIAKRKVSGMWVKRSGKVVTASQSSKVQMQGLRSRIHATKAGHI